MAKVFNPLLSLGAKGSVALVCYSNWRGMPVARRKPIPVYRMRTTQPINRNRLGWISRYWGTLSNAQRQTWRDYATTHPRDDGFGGTFIMSGANAFMHLSAVKGRLFGTVPSPNPPITPPVGAFATFTPAAGVNPGEITLSWTFDGASVAADKVELFATPQLISPGAMEVMKSLKSVGSVAGNLLTGVIAGLTPSGYYGVGIRYVDKDGQVSSKVTGFFTAHA